MTDFTLVQNNDKDLRLTLKDPETLEALNLAGVQAIVISLFPRNSAEAVFTKTLGDGIVVTTAASGIITMRIDKEDIETISGHFRFDGKITDSNGKVVNLRNADHDWMTCEILKSLL